MYGLALPTGRPLVATHAATLVLGSARYALTESPSGYKLKSDTRELRKAGGGEWFLFCTKLGRSRPADSMARFELRGGTTFVNTRTPRPAVVVALAVNVAPPAMPRLAGRVRAAKAYVFAACCGARGECVCAAEGAGEPGSQEEHEAMQAQSEERWAS